MKTLTTLPLAPIILLLNAAIPIAPLSAQPDAGTTVMLDAATPAIGHAPIDVRYDLVNAGLQPTSDPIGALQRSIRPGEDGHYLVRIVSPYGQVRMCGAFLDEHATVPDGRFEFYYADGTLESRGLYVAGMKWGTWERYAPDGAQRAERIYGNLNMEELRIALGEAEEVCTITAQ